MRNLAAVQIGLVLVPCGWKVVSGDGVTPATDLRGPRR